MMMKYLFRLLQVQDIRYVATIGIIFPALLVCYSCIIKSKFCRRGGAEIGVHFFETFYPATSFDLSKCHYLIMNGTQWQSRIDQIVAPTSGSKLHYGRLWRAPPSSLH